MSQARPKAPPTLADVTTIFLFLFLFLILLLFLLLVFLSSCLLAFFFFGVQASRVIDLFADGPEAAGLGPAAGAAAGVASVVPRTALDSAYTAIAAVRVTEEVKQGLILFLHCLSTK